MGVLVPAPHSLPTRSSNSRWASRLLLPLLVLTPLVLVAVAPPASAVAPTVTVSVSGDGEVIAGDNTTCSISAHNGGATDGFNLGLILDVPEGIAFVSSSLGTPVIYDSTNPPPVPLPAGIVRWVWEDVSDLPASGTYSGTVTVHPTQPPIAVGTETSATNVFPVGSTYIVNATAALGGNPTYLPVFNGSTGVGGPIATAETGTDGPAPATTHMIALDLTKSEPSPEAELLRGTHDQTTVYTLTVRNTTQGATNNAVLVDHIPAGLEFLGCGGVDNSTVDRGLGDGTVNEYDGSATLAGTPVIVANCPTPVSIDTVVADAAMVATYGVTLGAVYTEVMWNLGTLAAGSTTTVRYAAAVPLYENTVTWDAVAPTAGSLGQAANLDNNNGPSTRHGDPAIPIDGDTWTNVANISGDYAGVIRTATPRATTDRAATTIYAMDLSILKDVDPADITFDVGNITDYTLTLRASEYMHSSAIYVTDELPNGLCPLRQVTTSLTIDPGAVIPPECDVGGATGGADMTSVTAHADGTFTIVFRPTSVTYPNPDDFVLDPNTEHQITYTALDRSAYQTAPTEYGPTTSGDGFGNVVSFVAVTDAIPNLLTWFPDTWNVWDDSGSSIDSDLTTITKLVMPRDQVQADLPPGSNPCTVGTFGPGPMTGFRLGDTVCFQLRVNFPSSIDVRNPVIADFLPDGLTYSGHEIDPASTVPPGEIFTDASAAADGRLQWRLGHLGDLINPDLYVTRGEVLIVDLWATVDRPSSGPILDKPQNLMKYRQQNVLGELYFLRDQADIEIQPELDLIKGVESVKDNSSASSSTRPAVSQDAPDGTTFASNRDGVEVREGEVVTYRVDLRTMPYGATNAQVWDALPAGITAANVSNISDDGTAYDPGDPGYPAGIDPTLNTRSLVLWTGVAVPYDAIALEARKTLTYDVTIPIGTSVATSHTNDASVISYQASVNTSSAPDAQDYYPTDSFDTSLSTLWNTPGTFTRDDSNVYLPSASIDKTVTSPTDTNNSATQVVKGEIFHFTYTATIPAHSSVRNAVLSDALVAPAGNWSLDGSLTTVDYPGGSTAPGDASFTIGSDTFAINAATGLLTFPALYTNTTDSDQTFAVNLYGHITSAATWTHNTGTRRDDTATFASSTQPSVIATSGVYVIEPQPVITKLVNDDTVTAGQTVTYTLTARNGSNSANGGNRPTSYDTQVIDCVPVELTGVSLGLPTQGSAAIAPDVSCAGTRIVWDVGALLSGTTNQRILTYTATVSPASAGLATYTNTAGITGYSLDDDLTDRQTYTGTTTESVTVLGALLTKSVDVPTATIGQERGYTISVTLPADVNFYDAALIDNVPAGTAISGISLACTYGAGGSCLGDLPGGGAALTTSGTLHGWWLGDVFSNPDTRTITITYTGTVLNVPGNLNGATLVDTARLRWSTTNLIVGPPADASYTPDASTTPVSATVTVVEPATSIVKHVNSLDSDDVAPGESFTYTVTVTNTGTSTAYDVTVNDVIPDGVVVDGASVTAAGGVLVGADPITGGGTIAWGLGSLAVGAPSAHTFTYTAVLAPSGGISAADSFTNVATVTGFTSHPTSTPGFDDGELRTYSGPWADAVVTPDFPQPTITKTPAPGPAYIGVPHTFTIVVTNSGDSLAQSGQVIDTLPTDWSYNAGSTTINGVAAADPAISGQDLTWSSLPSLNPTAHVTIVYTASPDSSATWTTANTGAVYHHTNNATVTVDDASSAPGNLDGTYDDSTSAWVAINRADLVIDKVHAGSPTAGDPFSWTVTVTNAGPDTAVGPFVVVDTLPADATYTGFTGTGWADDTSVAGQVTFTHAGTLANGGALPIITVSVTLPADLAVDTDFNNSATVSDATFDVDLTNNTDADPARTVIVADVGITKTTMGGPFTAGEDISWDIVVTNYGPSVAAAPFTVTDALPSNVDWTSVTAGGTGWSCDPVTGAGDLVCRWSSATLDVGDDTDTLAVIATTQPSAVGTIDNWVGVTHGTPDPNPGNDTDTTSDPIGTSADLSLNKSTVSIDIPADGIGRFRVEVANAGPSDALNVIVTDSLPGGLTYAGNLTAAPGDTWTCTENIIDPTQVDCTLDSNGGTLPLGGSSWFEFDVQADSTVTAAVLNFATVASDTPDPNADNNTDDSATAPVLIVNKAASPASVARGSTLTYTINVESMSYGATDDVTLTDPVPASLQVTEIAIGLSSNPTVPNWLSCGLAGADANGYGGTITCVLAGTLERGRTTPNITVTAVVSPTTTPGSLLNVATVDWTDPLNLVAGVFSAVDDATVTVTLTARELAATGPSALGLWIALALAAMTAGLALLLAARRLRDKSAGA